MHREPRENAIEGNKASFREKRKEKELPAIYVKMNRFLLIDE